MNRTKPAAFLSSLAACSMLLLILSCCKSNSSGLKTGAEAKSARPPVVLTFFSNNPDRTAGQGLVEQRLIDTYLKLHPSIRILVDTLSPDPQYQDKIKIENASNQLPDIFAYWPGVTFLAPLVNNHALAEWQDTDVQDMGFVPEALDSFRLDGKLYGLPKNQDFWVLYYNKKIFADNGLKIPATQAELLHVFKVLKARHIIPIAMDGQDPWTSMLWLRTMLERASGSWDYSRKAMDRTDSFLHPPTVLAASAMQEWIRAGAFGSKFLNDDYATARSLFGQGKAAMYMMGEWEMGIAFDRNFPEEVRSSIGAFPIPSIDGGKGHAGDLDAWYGAGFLVSDRSVHKKEAMQFVKWMFRPEGWTKTVWQSGIAFPAQDYRGFITGREAPVQQDLLGIYSKAASYSGDTGGLAFVPQAEKMFNDGILRLEGLQQTPRQFEQLLDNAAVLTHDQFAKY
ncbi:ABC transporter substrate-binding protein [Paenibacillus humicola]|uniref:ABC transporter substrate-binding protein n=1 Tax=Paenibacillus humicola TaxID=3110540 RepID=UPI00237BE9AF|nr:extracellular solute-binding protein [Paenibacillus humicola]